MPSYTVRAPEMLHPDKTYSKNGARKALGIHPDTFKDIANRLELRSFDPNGSGARKKYYGDELLLVKKYYLDTDGSPASRELLFRAALAVEESKNGTGPKPEKMEKIFNLIERIK